MAEAATAEQIAARMAPLRRQWGEQLEALGDCISAMGRAMVEGDDILGGIASQGIVNHLPELPRHIRELFLEYASDEAAHGAQTDRRFWQAQEGADG